MIEDWYKFTVVGLLILVRNADIGAQRLHSKSSVQQIGHCPYTAWSVLLQSSVLDP